MTSLVIFAVLCLSATVLARPSRSDDKQQRVETRILDLLLGEEKRDNSCDIFVNYLLDNSDNEIDQAVVIDQNSLNAVSDVPGHTLSLSGSEITVLAANQLIVNEQFYAANDPYAVLQKRANGFTGIAYNTGGNSGYLIVEYSTTKMVVAHCKFEKATCEEKMSDLRVILGDVGL